MKVEIRKSSDGQFYFAIIARNHKTVAVSELYKSKQACKKGINCIYSLANYYMLWIVDTTKRKK